MSPFLFVYPYNFLMKEFADILFLK